MINQVIGVSWQHPLSNRELEVPGPQCVYVYLTGMIV